MNKAIVTKPDEGAASAFFAALLCLTLSLRELRDISEKIRADWISVIFFMVFAGMAIYWARQWLRRRKCAWNITWEGTHVRIENEASVAYDGDLSAIHLVDQDGSGYFLYITPKVVFRLRRGESSVEFESILDQTKKNDKP